MTTTLTLLGTAGGPTPRGHRHAPAHVVVVDGDAYVFDCGNGVADQLVRACIPFSAIKAIIITHNHSDHNADLGTLLLLGWSGLTEPVQVYGPTPTVEPMRHFLAMSRYDIDIRVKDEGRPPLDTLFEAHDLSEAGPVYSDEKVTVTTALVDHPPLDPALGYRIDTPDRSIAFSGDTRPCDNLIELAQGADILVHEALHEPAIGSIVAGHVGSTIREHLIESHTMSDQVGEVAQRAGVDTLVLSHLVPSDDTVDDETWMREASKHFDGQVIVGHDLLQI